MPWQRNLKLVPPICQQPSKLISKFQKLLISTQPVLHQSQTSARILKTFQSDELQNAFKSGTTMPQGNYLLLAVMQGSSSQALMANANDPLNYDLFGWTSSSGESRQGRTHHCHYIWVLRRPFPDCKSSTVTRTHSSQKLASLPPFLVNFPFKLWKWV